MIPQTLSKCKFCLIQPRSKKPFEKDWPNKPYSFNDPKLINHIKVNGNYGVLCGYNDLVVIDSDSHEFSMELFNKLSTFMIETGSSQKLFRKVHTYFKIKPTPKKCLIEKGGEHVGELQSNGTQVVGSGSTHPGGGEYRVLKDLPIQLISLQNLMRLLPSYVFKLEKKKPKAKIKTKNNLTNDLNVSDIVSISSLHDAGNEYYGVHPIHGSTTGMNFWVNPTQNVWHCFRCNSGGSWPELIAITEGLIDCSEATSGCLRGELFKQVLQIAKQRYGLRVTNNFKKEKSLWRCFTRKKQATASLIKKTY